jgi:hypothetical protein
LGTEDHALRELTPRDALLKGGEMREQVLVLVRGQHKNALFAGSDGDADRWAIVASLIETAKLNGIEPFAWLRDVLTRMVDGHPNQRLDDLLPWASA